jgi:predicted transcriptional regulator
MQDAVGKERLGKLTREEVEEIRNRYKNEDITQAELGQDYGVTQRHISDVVNGESW